MPTIAVTTASTPTLQMRDGHLCSNCCLNGDPTSPCWPCHTNGCTFEVQFYYDQAWGTHQCNAAEFHTFVGDRPLGDIDLNNGNDGGSRFSAWFPVLLSDFNRARCSYIFSTTCALSSCHTGIIGMKFRKNGIVIFDLPRQSGDQWDICVPDVCNKAP